MTRETDLVVIGLGALGATALREAARRGIEAVGVDQYDAGHENGASGGKTRIFRVAYKEGEHWVPLLTESRREWELLQRDSEETIWEPTGALTIGRRGNDDVERVIESLSAHALPAECYSSAEAAERWPQHRLDADDVVVHDQLGGLLRPDAAIRAVLSEADALGAERIHGAAMTNLVDGSGYQEVTLSTGETIRAKRVLLTMGPWAATAVPQVADELKLNRIMLTWFAPDQPDQFAPQAFPVGIRRSGEGKNFSFFPQTDEAGFKINFHVPRETLDVMGAASATVDPGYIDWVASRVPDVMNGVSATPARAAAFVDAFTPDHRLLCGPVPGRANVWALTGGSGHAFKIAPALARQVIDLLEGKEADTRFLRALAAGKETR